jgi:hypothetical protein
MSCCGQVRQQMRSQAGPAVRADNTARAASSEQSLFDQRGAAFQYVGKTAMTAIGLVSGRQYRFASPGAILQVDPRDRASLAAVPNLRQI